MTAADVGLAAVPAATRGGEDARRRGWFWHWNSLVTQYAPLIGLKGVGLLNSYTVWTDRREESPHRGYAFPSQQSEADFYGEDRSELITINKILVALDLIEIRKEMVLRTDPQGRRWRVPHNFYRVKDHDDGFTLSGRDVLRVAELADRDRAVYRYVRRVFSPRFAPIDGANVWSTILPEVRQTELWHRLAARAAAEEDRASARTRAGHAARKAGVAPNQATAAPGREEPAGPSGGEPPDPAFFARGDGAGSATPAARNDTDAADTGGGAATVVATINRGSMVDVEPSNNGLDRDRRTRVAGVNQAERTAVDRGNTTYHQPLTTTTNGSDGEFGGEVTAAASPPAHDLGPEWTGSLRQSEPVVPAVGEPAAAPGGGPDEAAAVRAFEDANARRSTPAERKLLRDLAARFAPAAAATARGAAGSPGSGWAWIAAAVYEAVEAGSAFVAPRRLREIMGRWERDGYPHDDAGDGVGATTTALAPSPSPEIGGGEPRGAPAALPRRAAAARQGDAAVPASRVASGVRDDGPMASTAPAGPAPATPPALFVVEECGLASGQVWAAVLAEVAARGEVGRADVDAWLRGTVLLGRGGDGGAGTALVVGAPHALAQRRVATRFLPALRAAVAAVVGAPLPVEVVVARDWADGGAGANGRDDAAARAVGGG